MTPQNPLERKIENNESLTRDELRSLRGALAALPQERLEALKAKLGTYETAKQAELKADADKDAELKALQQDVERMRVSRLSPLGKAGATYGEKAGEALDTAVSAGKTLANDTVANAKALTYAEFAAFQDPNKTTGEKILRGLGIVGLLYGGYRAAKWVVGRKGDSFLGRMFRFLGVSAAAVAAVNYFGKQKQSAAPAAAPAAAPNAVATSLFGSLPEGSGLIDNVSRPFKLDGAQHTIAFTHRRICVDGKNFGMSALKADPFGNDVALDITRAQRNGTSLTLEAGAFGKKGSIVLDETQASAVLRALLAGGPYDTKTADGVDIRIARL